MEDYPRGRLLVVDDDAMVRELLGLAAVDAGFEAVLAADDREAVAAVEARQAADLVGLITDIHLAAPRDGWFLAQLARAHRPDLPVVYVSGASGHDWARLGVSGSLFLHKPFIPQHVVDAVQALLGRSPGQRCSALRGPAS